MTIRYLVLPLLLASYFVAAQTLGTFAATGNMTTPRQTHSAAALPDGTVLIGGGYSYSLDGARRGVPTDTAEFYDPDRGTFTPTGSMKGLRGGHSATLLANGKVLIAGGYDGQAHWLASCMCNFLSTAELYDPVTETFTPTGDMTALVAGPIATLLSDGRVWITTGDDGPNVGAQLYDPNTGTFSHTGWMDPRSLIPATVNLLASGRLLVTLNGSECDFNSSSAGIHDVPAGAFRDAALMAYRACRPTAVTLSDGSVLISGGRLDGPDGRPAQVYDPVSGVFSRTGEMAARRTYHTATLLRSGNVLIAGVCPDDCLTGTAASAEIYTPTLRKPAPLLLPAFREKPEQGAILHTGTSQFASNAFPAVAGEILEIYLTGLLEESVIPPQVTIGGRTAEVLFFGKAGEYPDLNHINVRVPAPGRRRT